MIATPRFPAVDKAFGVSDETKHNSHNAFLGRAPRNRNQWQFDWPQHFPGFDRERIYGTGVYACRMDAYYESCAYTGCL